MNANEKEMLRHATLEVLAAAHPVPRQARGIHRAVAVLVPFAASVADVEAALELLRGLGFVHAENDPLGSSLWWTATAAGILHLERARQ